LYNYQSSTDNFEITDIVVSDALNLIIAGHQYIKKTGTEIIDHFGMLTVWKFPLWDLNSTEFVMNFPFPNGISKLLYSETDKELIIGADNGKLYIASMEDVMNHPIEAENPTATLFMSRIVDIIWLTQDKILAAIGDDNYLKIFDYNKQKIVSGGSLSKRLKDDTLTCIKMDNDKRIYLSTRENSVIIYEIVEPKYQFKYLFTVFLESIKSPIRSLTFYKG